jgi:hypothetical protein
MAAVAALHAGLRRLALTLLLAASLMHGLLPAGYMAAAADGGGLAIRLCGGAGEAHFVRFDLASGRYSELPAEPGQGDAGQDDGACPFAVAAAPALAARAALPAPITAERTIEAAVPAAPSAPADLVHTPLSARGPPLQA